MSNKVNLGGTATKIGHHDNENSQYMIKNDHGGSKYWRAQAPIKVAGGMLSGTGLQPQGQEVDELDSIDNFKKWQEQL
jgi:hypothetical protein